MKEAIIILCEINQTQINTVFSLTCGICIFF